MDQEKTKIKIAAIGDIHVTENSLGAYRGLFTDISKKADILALCGDLTQHGLASEAKILADDLAALTIPVVAVLGNHDHHSDTAHEVKAILKAAHVHFVEDEAFVFRDVGFAGVKGFGGGFIGHMLTPFGEKTIKDFVAEAVNEALNLENTLHTLETDKMAVLLHYSPIADTVRGEPEAIFPFLGSGRLEESINHFPVKAVFHGHAHHGTYAGKTSRGIPVYNCAFEIMRKRNPAEPYALIEL
jgi:Icc-related predicted phosphoesterase